MPESCDQLLNALRALHTALLTSLVSQLLIVASTLPAYSQHTHTHTHPFNTLPGWAGTRKVKPIWILLKQETVSGSGISWAICKSAHRSRQITTPTPHHSVSYRPDALPVAQPTVSKHWRNTYSQQTADISVCYQHLTCDIYTMFMELTSSVGHTDIIATMTS